MIFGVGAEMRKQKWIFIFRYMEQFQEKLGYTLTYHANSLQFLQNYLKWFIVGDDPNFGDFLGPKFPSFSMEGSGRK